MGAIMSKQPDIIHRSTGILWGLTKCGKTTFLMSLPGRILYIMIDPDGDEVLPELPERIKTIRLYTYSDAEIIRMLEKNIPAHLVKNADDYDSCVIDSTTSIGRCALNVAIEEGIGASKREGFVPTLSAPGQAAYGARTQHIIEIVNKNLRATATVGKHCWFTAHEDEAKTSAAGDILHITMALSGKTINGAGLNVSEIWHMRLRDGEQWLSIAPCRKRKPMGTRMFGIMGDSEFQLKYDPELGPDQPHSIATWFQKYQDGGRKKLSLPKLPK